MPAQRSQRNHDLYIYNETNETPFFGHFVAFVETVAFVLFVGYRETVETVETVDFVIFVGYREIVISLISLVS